jgi:hypothetical protein
MLALLLMNVYFPTVANLTERSKSLCGCGSYLLIPNRLSGQGWRGHECIFFKVSQIEHNEYPSQTNDLDTGVCWVDPETTRIIQLGIEHSKVPCVNRYLKAGS